MGSPEALETMVSDEPAKRQKKAPRQDLRPNSSVEALKRQTPRGYGDCAELASVDPTESRNDILGCFGRSDRIAQRSGPLNTHAVVVDNGSPRRSSARIIGNRSS
jgi:hypothetical protein